MPSRRPLLKACLNGARPVGSVAGLPVTPSEVARDALAAWEAGARAVHVHPRNAKGREGLDAGTIGATVTAIRSDVPDVPVGVSTGAWIEPDADARLALVRSWQVLPDFASVNWHEDGAERIAEGYGVAVAGELVQARQTGHAIVDEAVERNVDLVILGIGYNRPYGRFELGSEAKYVLEHASAPVWLIRDEEPSAQ